MKQESKMDSLTTCISALQRQSHCQRLELEDAFFGYESRQEQLGLQDDLVMREKALRETQIRSILEMEELGRAQELRVEEFSGQTLKERVMIRYSSSLHRYKSCKRG